MTRLILLTKYWGGDTAQNIKHFLFKKIHMVGWVGGWLAGWFFQDIIALHGSILQVGTRQILSLAENPRWSRVWQKYSNNRLKKNMITTIKQFLDNC